MNDLNQLIEERKVKLQELEGVLQKSKTEKREMFTTENEKFESINTEIRNIDTEINDKQKNNIKVKNTNDNKMEKFSLIKSIRNVVEGRNQDPVSLAVLDAGKEGFANAGLSFRGNLTVPFEFEERATIAADTSDPTGGYAIGVQQFDMLGALRGNLVAVKAGATLLSGLVGDISIPVYAGSTAAWKGENNTAVTGEGAFSEVTMTPHRLTFFIDISKQFLVQDSTNAESLLMRDLTEAIQGKLEQTMFSDDTGTGPDGLFNGAAYTNYGDATYAKVVALESALAGSNALTQNLAYITHPALVGVMKTTDKTTGASGNFIMNDSTNANGYPVYASSNVTKLGATGQTGTSHNGIIFANWADLLIGSWGSLDITVDPYTQAANGAVRLVVNSYWDIKRRRDVSFKYGSLA